LTFFRRHWYEFGAAVALATVVVLIALSRSLASTQMILALQFVAVLLHQYEEFGKPGGAPLVMNLALRKSPPDLARRYPLNQNSAMISNVGVVYLLYFSAAFLFPGMTWFGLAISLFSLFQIVIHGVLTPRAMGQLYNPGLATTVLLLVPLSLAYIYQVTVNGHAGVLDWILAIATFGGIAVVGVGFLTYVVLASKDSPYPFAPEELARFDVAQKLGRKPGAPLAASKHAG